MTGQERITNILVNLYSGQAQSIQDIIDAYNVSDRTAYRDIKVIQDALENQTTDIKLIENKQNQKYELSRTPTLSIEEVVAISKILLASRAFSQTEMKCVQQNLLNTALILKKWTIFIQSVK